MLQFLITGAKVDLIKLGGCVSYRVYHAQTMVGILRLKGPVYSI